MNKPDMIDEILWGAIVGAVTASINAPKGQVDTTDKSEWHFIQAKQALHEAFEYVISGGEQPVNVMVEMEHAKQRQRLSELEGKEEL